MSNLALEEGMEGVCFGFAWLFSQWNICKILYSSERISIEKTENLKCVYKCLYSYGAYNLLRQKHQIAYRFFSLLMIYLCIVQEINVIMQLHVCLTYLELLCVGWIEHWALTLQRALSFNNIDNMNHQRTPLQNVHNLTSMLLIDFLFITVWQYSDIYIR